MEPRPASKFDDRTRAPSPPTVTSPGRPPDNLRAVIPSNGHEETELAVTASTNVPSINGEAATAAAPSLFTLPPPPAATKSQPALCTLFSCSRKVARRRCLRCFHGMFPVFRGERLRARRNAAARTAQRSDVYEASVALPERAAMSAAMQDGTGNQGIVDDAFEASRTFQGARPGFVFKKGLWGVGYYPDLVKGASETPRPPPRAGDGVVRPMPQRCHYGVLGVAMQADDDELRKAYRRMALRVQAPPLQP